MQANPNIIIVNTHDSGLFFGCYGHPVDISPHLDAFAGDAVRLADFFATAPVCSPSRASFFSGQYPQRHGLLTVTQAPGCTGMKPDTRLLQHYLKDVGYEAALFGIQHIARDVASLPFDHVAQGNLPGRHPFSATNLATRFTDFLKNRDQSQPLYAEIGFFETHTPYKFDQAAPDPTEASWLPPGMEDAPETRAHFAWLQGNVREVDRGFEMVRQALRETGLEENTLLVFTSDHGAEFPRAKWSLYDDGLRVPLIMRWPKGGLTGGSTLEGLADGTDFLPTVLDLLGLELQTQVDGRSFAGHLRETTPLVHRDAVYANFAGELTSVRTKEHRLIRNYLPRPQVMLTLSRFSSEGDPAKFSPPAELYDVREDPRQRINLVEDPSSKQVLQAMDARLWQWMESVGDNLLDTPPRTSHFERNLHDYRNAVSSYSEG